MARRWLWWGTLILALLVSGGPQLASRVLSNAGLVMLARARGGQATASVQPLSAAQNLLQRALAWDEGNRSAHRGLGLVFLFNHDLLQAAGHWRDAGWTAADLLTRSDAAGQAGAPQLAWEYLAVAESLDDSLRSTLAYARYEALRGQDRSREALQYLEEAITWDAGWLDPADRLQAWLDWADWLLGQRMNPEAQRAAELALGLCADAEPTPQECWKAHSVLAQALMAQAAYQEAQTKLGHAIGAFPNQAWLRVRYGQAQYLLDWTRADEAQEQFLQAVGLRNEAGIWRVIIQFWMRQERPDLAQEWCRLAREAGQDTVAEVCPPP